MDELLGRHVDLKKVRKIGEGAPVACTTHAAQPHAARLPAHAAACCAARRRRRRRHRLAMPCRRLPTSACAPPAPLAGTFGEAFKAGGVVLKIVPMEGGVLVNGEPQKRADEILAEVSVTLTLSRLNGGAAAPGARGAEGHTMHLGRCAAPGGAR